MKIGTNFLDYICLNNKIIFRNTNQMQYYSIKLVNRQVNKLNKILPFQGSLI